MRIGELASRTGVSVRSLRYYEQQGLLACVRSPAGQRRYDEDAAERVELVQQLYAAGLSSRTIAGILPCVMTGQVVPELLERLTAERDRVDARIHELVTARDRLDAMIESRRGRVGACSGPADADQ